MHINPYAWHTHAPYSLFFIYIKSLLFIVVLHTLHSARQEIHAIHIQQEINNQWFTYMPTPGTPWWDATHLQTEKIFILDLLHPDMPIKLHISECSTSLIYQLIWDVPPVDTWRMLRIWRRNVSNELMCLSHPNAPFLTHVHANTLLDTPEHKQNPCAYIMVHYNKITVQKSQSSVNKIQISSQPATVVVHWLTLCMSVAVFVTMIPTGTIATKKANDTQRVSSFETSSIPIPGMKLRIWMWLYCVKCGGKRTSYHFKYI